MHNFKRIVHKLKKKFKQVSLYLKWKKYIKYFPEFEEFQATVFYSRKEKEIK